MIAELASRQHGQVARWQLRGERISPRAIDHRVARARLHVVHDGVYAVGHRAPSRLGRQTAAVLACGPGALLAMWSAAGLHELLRWNGRPHVTAPRSRGPRPGIVVHTSRRLSPMDGTQVHGVPVTTWARTIVDLADVLPVVRIARLLEQAAINRVYDHDELLATIERLPGRRGSRRLREALARGDHLTPQQTRSLLEAGFLDLVRGAQPPLPQVRTNVWIPGVGEVDALWSTQRVAVELDGARFHAHAGAIERDAAKTRALQHLGYRVVRLRWADVARDPAALVRRLRGLLGPAAPAPPGRPPWGGPE